MTELFTKSCLSINEFGSREHEWFAWSSPSNIALAKYWGKKDHQIPENPSVSLSLNTCRTNMMVISSQNISGCPVRSFYFNKKKSNEFGKKAFSLIEKMAFDFPLLKNFDLQIITENTFPHSSGIASSASSMSALALCMAEFLYSVCGEELKNYDFYQFASNYSRLGSGSACRSVFGGVALWGESTKVPSSNKYAVPVDGIDKCFMSFKDSVLIISSEQKSVSSTAGHELMNSHPFREARYKNASANCDRLIDLMRAGDVWNWGEVLEREALELHGLMMNGKNSYILIKPNTLAVIEKVRNFRLTKNIPLFFTLDAGPNVHLLYPQAHEKVVKDFIHTDLIDLCENNIWFDDEVGSGPINLKIKLDSKKS